MNLSEKEKWVENTLDSLDGSQRAQAPEGLFEKALHRAAYGRARIVRIPATQVWSAAACALVLVVANLFICIDFSHSDKQAVGSKEMFVKEYFGTSDDSQF